MHTYVFLASCWLNGAKPSTMTDASTFRRSYRVQTHCTLKKSSHVHALPMTRRGNLTGVAYWLPSIRETWGEAKACPIKIPQRTCTNCFTLLQVCMNTSSVHLVRSRGFAGAWRIRFQT